MPAGNPADKKKKGVWRVADDGLGSSKPMEDMHQWTELQKLLISYLKTDKVIHNPSRIMRVAGTVTFPPKKKLDLGYVSEVTKLLIGGHYVE